MDDGTNETDDVMRRVKKRRAAFTDAEPVIGVAATQQEELVNTMKDFDQLNNSWITLSNNYKDALYSFEVQIVEQREIVNASVAETTLMGSQFEILPLPQIEGLNFQNIERFSQDQLINRVQQEIVKNTGKFNQVILDLKLKVKQLKKEAEENEDLGKETEKLKNEVLEQTSRLVTAENSLSVLQEFKNSIQEVVKDEDVRDDRDGLITLVALVQEHMSRIVEQNEIISNFQTRLDEQETAYLQMQRNLDAARAEITRLEEIRDETAQRFAEFEATVQQRGLEREQAQKSLSDLTNGVEILRQTLTSLSSQKEEARAEIEVLIQRNQELAKQAENQTNKIKEKTNELEAEKLKFETEKLKFTAQAEKVAQQQEFLEDSEEQLESNLKSLQVLNADLNSLKEQQKIDKINTAKARKEKEKLEQKMAQLTAETIDAEEKLGKLTKEYKTGEQKDKELKKTIEKQKKEYDKLIVATETAQDDINDIQKEIRLILEGEEAPTNEEADRMELDEISVTRLSTDAKIVLVKKDIKRLETAVARYDKRIQTAKTKLEKLELELKKKTTSYELESRKFHKIESQNLRETKKAEKIQNEIARIEENLIKAKKKTLEESEKTVAQERERVDKELQRLNALTETAKTKSNSLKNSVGDLQQTIKKLSNTSKLLQVSIDVASTKIKTQEKQNIKLRQEYATITTKIQEFELEKKQTDQAYVLEKRQVEREKEKERKRQTTEKERREKIKMLEKKAKKQQEMLEKLYENRKKKRDQVGSEIESITKDFDALIASEQSLFPTFEWFNKFQTLAASFIRNYFVGRLRQLGAVISLASSASGLILTFTKFGAKALFSTTAAKDMGSLEKTEKMLLDLEDPNQDVDGIADEDVAVLDEFEILDDDLNGMLDDI